MPAPVTLPAEIWEADLTAADIAVYGAIASYRNTQSGACYPSIRAIADRAHVNKATAVASVRRLEALGFLLTTRKDGVPTAYDFPMDCTKSGNGCTQSGNGSTTNCTKSGNGCTQSGNGGAPTVRIEGMGVRNQVTGVLNEGTEDIPYIKYDPNSTDEADLCVKEYCIKVPKSSSFKDKVKTTMVEVVAAGFNHKDVVQAICEMQMSGNASIKHWEVAEYLTKKRAKKPKPDTPIHLQVTDDEDYGKRIAEATLRRALEDQAAEEEKANAS